MKKTTKIISLLLILAASVFTSCSTPAASGDPSTGASASAQTSPTLTSINLPAASSYKVETGVVTPDDYMTVMSEFLADELPSFDQVKTYRDNLATNSLNGTYQNRGTMSVSEINTYIVDGGLFDSGEANETLHITDVIGNYILAHSFDSSNGNVTWVYIER